MPQNKIFDLMYNARMNEDFHSTMYTYYIRSKDKNSITIANNHLQTAKDWNKRYIKLCKKHLYKKYLNKTI